MTKRAPPHAMLGGPVAVTYRHRAATRRANAVRAPLAPSAAAPPAVAHRACQWIAADPRRDPSKCGAAVVPGCAWCAAHRARVFLLPGAGP